MNRGEAARIWHGVSILRRENQVFPDTEVDK